MSIAKQYFTELVKAFQFKELFNELGWDHIVKKETVAVNNEVFQLEAVAEKKGFVVLICSSVNNGKIPNYNIRKKIDNIIAKLFFEHLIVYIDQSKNHQVWQLTIREQDKPAVTREINYYSHQEPELLYQKREGLFFSLDDEEKISIADVRSNIQEQFNVNAERVTKQFYDKFKNEHTSFLQFIKGIDNKINKDWYASLMLNRLMFCYFIQKKGFLDNNKNYLREKLKACQDQKGKNKFYSFYRNFLLLLFHKGLGAPDHSKELEIEIGKIPYLNGGLFDENEVEKTYSEISIEDKAFEHIFNFFDQYEWHLDTRITATGRDINPDVIGYIFEKYINDRAQMGAYYTKEDITEYISKNSVLPYLFDKTKRQYPKAFVPDSDMWRMLKENKDAYIYKTVQHGTTPDNLWNDLPEDVKAGLDPCQQDLVKKRKCWNKPAPSDIALPNETYREVIERRKRYYEVRQKIEKDEVTNINDFITYNLNIRQFAQDIMENTTDSELIKHFYKSLTNITILDPTCGSGAFLFAALNILEPLYVACIQRMENFVKEAPKGKYRFFEEILTQVKAPEHPNLPYFIFKSIILYNLYGVDIMKEAVEIAKLRLFLKLVATVDADYRKPNLGLEPLPDVDFNIRAGNTLIGYATEEELHEAFIGKMDFDNDEEKIKEKCDIVAKTYARYKEIQLSCGDDFKEFKKAKEELNKRLKELNEELNQLLHKHSSDRKYEKWLETHRPFHWFAEFYEIIYEKSGFDVIIGNPPYVEYSKVRKQYKVNHFDTIDCGNLHTYCLERGTKLKNEKGYLGFIVPLAIISTPRMSSAVDLMRLSNTIFCSSFECRPAKLFIGADIRLSIIILSPIKEEQNEIYTSKLIKFTTTERPILFDMLSYQSLSDIKYSFSLIPKFNNKIEVSIYNKLFDQRNKLSKYISDGFSPNKLYYSYGFRYWAKVLSKPTYFESQNADRSTGEKELSLLADVNKNTIGAALSSNLFYWYYVVTSDAHNFTKHIIYNFPFDLFESKKLDNLFFSYQEDLEDNSTLKKVNYQATGTITYREYYIKKSKLIIDKIDKLLAGHYDFTGEELDFIINFDIKYRMGIEPENEE
jgi:tRNA1(Val) A37 N6-methylase TrmN6